MVSHHTKYTKICTDPKFPAIQHSFSKTPNSTCLTVTIIRQQLYIPYNGTIQSNAPVRLQSTDLLVYTNLP